MKKLAAILLLVSIFGYLYFNFFPQQETELKFTPLLQGVTPKYESEIEVDKRATLTFVGDIMVDRYIRKIAENNSYEFLFKNVRDEFRKSDVVIANLEGPVTDFESISNSEIPEKRFYFTFSEKVLPVMFDANIRIVTIDNNHITNFGPEGLAQTIQKITRNNLDYFGNPNDKKILFKNINGIDLAFISYNQFINPDEEKTIQLIREAEMSADHTIIFAHWGDEYQYSANLNQENLAKSFIDAGADLVIGAHSHVIGNTEVYKNKYIYYSLGNFIFDQYFSKQVSCGLVVTFNITEKDIQMVEEKTVKMDPYSVVKFENCRT